MLELDHLTVSGDVTFGKGVSLKVCQYIILALEARNEASIETPIIATLTFFGTTHAHIILKFATVTTM